MIFRKGGIGAVLLFLAFAVQTFAIEGLQLSLQCSNVVLSWPSVDGETYIVQYRPNLDTSTPWQTLTNSFPADWTSNVTVFVHSNIIQHPNCGEAGSGSPAAMSLTGSGVATITPPTVDVKPELESDYQKRMKMPFGKMFIRTNAPARFERPTLPPSKNEPSAQENKN